MARRATWFKEVRQNKSQAEKFFLAGPFEFIRPGGNARNREMLKDLSRTYSDLGYALGVLSAEEAETFADFGVEKPETWLRQQETVLSKIFDVQAGRVGVVVFPPAKKQKDETWQKVQADVLAAASKLDQKVDLLVGISSWGYNLEREFLQSNELSFFHLILGSGQGPSVSEKFFQKDKVLWVRPYSKGQAVHVLKILDWSKKSWQSGWKPGQNIAVSQKVLQGSIPEDKTINSYFEQ